MWVVLSDGGSTDALIADFNAVSEDVGDMSEPLGRVIKRILGFVREQFASEGAASGRFPWVRLSDRYSNWKESRVPGLPLLVGVRPVGRVGSRDAPVGGKTYERSGRMLAEATAPGTISVRPTRAVYQPLSDKLAYHQFGTKNMPARPPVLFSAAEEARWPQPFISWLDAQLVGRAL